MNVNNLSNIYETTVKLQNTLQFMIYEQKRYKKIVDNKKIIKIITSSNVWGENDMNYNNILQVNTPMQRAFGSSWIDSYCNQNIRPLTNTDQEKIDQCQLMLCSIHSLKQSNQEVPENEKVRNNPYPLLFTHLSTIPQNSILCPMQLLDNYPLNCYVLPPNTNPRDSDIYPTYPCLVTNEIFSNAIKAGFGMYPKGWNEEPHVDMSKALMGYIMPAANFDPQEPQVTTGYMDLDGVDNPGELLAHIIYQLGVCGVVQPEKLKVYVNFSNYHTLQKGDVQPENIKMHIYYPQFAFKDIISLGIFNSVITNGKADFHVTTRSGLFRGPHQIKFDLQSDRGVYNSFVVFSLVPGQKEQPWTTQQLATIAAAGVHILESDQSELNPVKKNTSDYEKDYGSYHYGVERRQFRIQAEPQVADGNHQWLHYYAPRQLWHKDVSVAHVIEISKGLDFMVRNERGRPCHLKGMTQKHYQLKAIPREQIWVLAYEQYLENLAPKIIKKIRAQAEKLIGAMTLDQATVTLFQMNEERLRIQINAVKTKFNVETKQLIESIMLSDYALHRKTKLAQKVCDSTVKLDALFEIAFKLKQNEFAHFMNALLPMSRLSAQDFAKAVASTTALPQQSKVEYFKEMLVPYLNFYDENAGNVTVAKEQLLLAVLESDNNDKQQLVDALLTGLCRRFTSKRHSRRSELSASQVKERAQKLAVSCCVSILKNMDVEQQFDFVKTHLIRDTLRLMPGQAIEVCAQQSKETAIALLTFILPKIQISQCEVATIVFSQDKNEAVKEIIVSQVLNLTICQQLEVVLEDDQNDKEIHDRMLQHIVCRMQSDLNEIINRVAEKQQAVNTALAEWAELELHGKGKSQ